MTAFGIGITSNDPITVFGPQRPGRFGLIGHQKPIELIDAELASDEAWEKYNKAVNQRLDWLDCGVGDPVSEDALDHLYNELISAETVLRFERAKWNHSFTLVTFPEKEVTEYQ